jgi:hypothetical protein
MSDASPRTDLEQDIRESYALIREYEDIVRTTDRPEEKARARRIIEEQQTLIQGYLVQYLLICDKTDAPIPEDVVKIADLFGGLPPLSEPSRLAPPNEKWKKLPLYVWLLVGFGAILVLALLLGRRLRCLLEYRVTEAIVALIVLLVSGITAALTALAPLYIRRVLLSINGGAAFALLLGIIVHLALPSPPPERCNSSLPTPTPVLTLNIKMDSVAVESEQTLPTNVRFAQVEAEMLSDGTPMEPGRFEYKWTFNPRDAQNQDMDWSRTHAIPYYVPQQLQYQALTVQVRGAGQQWSKTIRFRIEE